MKMSITIDENYEKEIFQDLEELLHRGEPVGLLIGKKRAELHFIKLDKTTEKVHNILMGSRPKWLDTGSFELESIGR